MKVDQGDRLTDSRDGAISVVSLVLAVLAAYKILTYTPISMKNRKNKKKIETRGEKKALSTTWIGATHETQSQVPARRRSRSVLPYST
jgi:hypothetical protein